MDSTTSGLGRASARSADGLKGFNAAAQARAATAPRLRIGYIWLAALAAACLFSLLAASVAGAYLTSSSYAGLFNNRNAGAASNYTMAATFNYSGQDNNAANGDDIKKLVFDWPAGLIGTPTQIPAAQRCDLGDPASIPVGSVGQSPNYATCPASSKIGTIEVDARAHLSNWLAQLGGCGDLDITLVGSMYLLNSHPSAPEVPTYVGIAITGTPPGFLCALAGAQAMTMTAKIVVRDEDQGLRIKMIDGLPNDMDTGSFGIAQIRVKAIRQTALAVTSAGKPFLRNPTRCAGSSGVPEVDRWRSTVYARTYSPNTGSNLPPGTSLETIDGETYVKVNNIQDTIPQCGGQGQNNPPFNPQISIVNKNQQAGAPTGIQATITAAPELNDPTKLQPSQIKKVSMVMPLGFRVNPAIAERLQDPGNAANKSGCTEAQFNRPNPSEDPTGAGKCPGWSQIGTVAVTVPEMSQDLVGRLFLGQPQAGDMAAPTPGDPNRRSIFRLYMWATRGGVSVKMEGRARVNQTVGDPNYGQIAVEFGDPSYTSVYSPGLPQFMYSKFVLDFDSGSTGVGNPPSGAIWGADADRQMMMNPQVCGSYPMDTYFTPWTSPVQGQVVRSSTMTVTAGNNGSCNYRPFAQDLVTNPFAVEDGSGSVSTTGLGFGVRLTKDYDQTAAPASPNSLKNAANISGVGMHPTMTFKITRPDRMDNISQMRFVMPEGFGGSIKATNNSCSVATLNSIAAGTGGACPADAKVGDVFVDTGAGPANKMLRIFGNDSNGGGIFIMDRHDYAADPGSATGIDASMAGVNELTKYTAKLAIVTPAVVGPFDLGAVVNKLYMRLNSSSKFQLTAETGGAGLDQSIRGIPVLYRAITIKMQGINKQGTVTTADDRPFLILPSKCNSSLQFTGTITSVGSPPSSGPVTAVVQTTPTGAPTTTGCPAQNFDPTVQVSGLATTPATPTGMSVKVSVPQTETGVTESTIQRSTINRVRIQFPPGIEMNPAVATYLEACPTAAINADIANPNADTNTCEDDYPKSKLGDVYVNTPLLPNLPSKNYAVKGAMYLEQQGPTKESRMRFVLYLAMPGGQQIVRGGATVAGSTDGPTAGLGSTSETPAPGSIDTSVIDGTALQGGQLESDFNGLPDVTYNWMQLDFAGATAPDNHIVPMFVSPDPATCPQTNSTKVRVNATNTGATTTPASSPANVFFNTPGDPNLSFVTNADPGHPCRPAQQFAPSADIQVAANSHTSDPTRAAAHPDMTASILRSDMQKDLKKTVFHLPAGMTGAPTATVKCPLADALNANCPAASIVGKVEVELGSGPDTIVIDNGRIYNTEPANADEPARLTTIATVQLGPFDLGKMSIPILANLRAGDSGLDTTVELPQRFEGIRNHYRRLSMILYGYADQGTPDPSDDKPFLTNPSKCQVNTITLDAWAADGTQAPPADSTFTTTGCPMPFPAGALPTMTVSPTSTDSESPTGLNITMTNGGPSSFNPTVKSINIEFPYGMTVNPAVGNDGDNAACSTALIDAGGSGCPAESRRGEVHIKTPLLAGTYSGYVYLETPGSTKETRYRLAMVVQLPGQKLIIRGGNLIDGSTDITGPTGSVNTGTGVVTASFDNLVDLPFYEMQMNLYGGNHALLLNPSTCGSVVMKGEIAPHTGTVVTPNIVKTFSTYDVDGCESNPQPPQFEASLTQAKVGEDPEASSGHPNFNLTVRNPGKSPQLQDFDLDLPAGFVADTVATPRCSQADAVAGACAPNTVVGSVTTTMGSTAETLSLPGKLYNVVPDTSSQPARLQVIMSIDVGPFHLGKLSIPVYTTMRDDYGITTHTTLPYRYEGIDVFLRQFTLTVGGYADQGTPDPLDDKPFMINPTECGTHTITARITRRSGPPVAPMAQSINITGCPRSYSVPAGDEGPKLAVTPSTTETGVPAGMDFLVTNWIDNPTLKKIKMTMPEGMELNPAVGKNLTTCSTAKIDAGAGDCLNTTANVGTVVLTTPLLPVPQTGNVFIESPLGNDKDTRYRVAIVVHLPGKDLISRGKVTIPGSSTIPTGGTGAVDTAPGPMTTEFYGETPGSDLPDLAFSTMSVNFDGGNLGRPMFVNPRECKTAEFSAQFTAHGGDAVSTATDSYDTTSDCATPYGFTPTFNGSVNPTTSAANPLLTMTVTSPAKDVGIKKLDIDLPTGLVAATGNVPLCGIVASQQGNCDSASDIGDVSASIGTSNDTNEDLTINGNLYNVTPQAGEPARLAAGINVLVGPYNLGKLTLPITADLRSDWGVTTHTTLPSRYEGISVNMRAMTITLAAQVGGKPFAVNPSICHTNTLTATMTSDEPSPRSVVSSWSYDTDGCAAFNPLTAPTIAVAPSTTQAGVPVGLRIDVNSAEGNQTIKRTKVTFPQGLEINPAFADGLDPCPTSEINDAINNTGGRCASHTKIADVTMTTPLMSSRPQGALYIESPGLTKDDRYRVALILDLPGRTLVVRGAISIDGTTTIPSGGTGSVDTGTGVLTADFDNIPDLGFTQMRLDFNAGSRAMLVNPTTCTAHTFTGEFTPNSVGTTSSATASYTPTGCGASFAPTFTAAVSDTQAAGHPDLTLQVKNASNQQELRKLKVKLPVGLVANTTATTPCEQADASAGNCAAGSAIGDFSTVIGSTDSDGVVDDRVHLSGGKIYNVRPNSNEPARMQAVMPVMVGPFDLGKLSIEVTTKLNPDMSVDADTTIPKRYEGIAVKVRQMDMVLHGTAPGGEYFMVNPSRCATHTISGVMESVDGLTRTNSSNFTTTGCTPLAAAYAPSVTMTNTPTTAGAPTDLGIDVNLPDESSTTSNVKMTFPAGFELSPGAGDGLVACTTIDSDAGASCFNTSARLASVHLTTPLLPDVQQGELYLEPSIGSQAATRFRLALVVHLPGQNLVVRGGTLVAGSSDLATGLGSTADSGSADGHVTAEFPGLPDLGFSEMAIDFDGAKKLFVNPKTAGSFTVNSELTPHAGGGAKLVTSTLTTNGGTSSQNSFAPALTASLTPPDSGANADLHLGVTNADGMNEIKEMAITLPEGLVARTTGVPQCPLGTAQSGNCDPSSKVGTVTTTIGSYGETLAVTGDIVNVQPGDDQPARLFANIPVQVGPFDLGKLTLDIPTELNDDFTVTANASLPTRYEGIAVRVRGIDMTIQGQPNGNKFIVAPSECGPHTINASFTSNLGAVASSAASVTVGNCAGRDWVSPPQMTVSAAPPLRNAPVNLTFNLTSHADNPTIDKMTVVMPDDVEINPAFGASVGVCGTVDSDYGASCPANSKIGVVTLRTQLLDPNKDYLGTVYLEPQGPNAATRFRIAIVVHLPGAELVVHGKVTVAGATDITGGTGSTAYAGPGRITAEFDNIPDLGFTSLVVNFNTNRPMLINGPRDGAQQLDVTITPHTGGTDASLQPSYTTTGGNTPATFSPTFGATLSNTNAAAHPDLTLTVGRSNNNSQPLRDLDLELPVGLVASTVATTPRCTETDANAGNCAAGTKVGQFTTRFGNGQTSTEDLTLGGDIYNVEPRSDEPARLSAMVDVLVGPFDLGKLPIPIETELRPDAGINTTTQLPVRYEGIAVRIKEMQIKLLGTVGGKPFMQNPSKCGTSAIRARMTSFAAPWAVPAETTQTVVKLANITIGGCPLGFSTAPTISADVTPTETSVPAGLSLQINSDPANPTISKIAMALPAGMSVNANAGKNLVTCSPDVDQPGYGCAPGALQGTVAVHTPLLGQTYTGKVFLEDPIGNNKDTRYRMAIVLDLPGQSIVVRGYVQINGSTTIPTGGTGSVDTGTGLVTTVFDNIPDLSFDSFQIDLKTGPEALLTNPDTCGAHALTATITPSSGGADAVASDDITLSEDGLGGACPPQQPFAPSFSVSAADHTSGANTDLTLTVDSGNKDQQLTDFSVHLPAGLVADTDATAHCSQTDAANANCAADSEVGTVTSKIGTDSDINNTLDLSGTIHNVEPNSNEPARLVAIMPVVVGPYDLGKLSIQVPTVLRPLDYGVDASADIPELYEGIRVRLRQMQMTMLGQVGTPGNEQGFIKNPSKCVTPGTNAISATLTGNAGASATLYSDYAVTGCPRDFVTGSEPTVAVSGVNTEVEQPTGMTLDITSPDGNPAIGRIKTTLPDGMTLNPAVGNRVEVCSTAAIDAGGDACDPKSIVGTAEMETPLLAGTHTGEVVLEQSGTGGAQRYKLAVIIDLPGTNVVVHGVTLVDGSSDLTDGMGSTAETGVTGRITADFNGLPDLNFSHMRITFDNGPGALLANSSSCDVPQAVSAEFTPQSGGSTSTSNSASWNLSWDGVSAPCTAVDDRGFAPAFSGSVSTPLAAGNPDLNLSLSRPDKSQQLKEFDLHLPPGLVANTVATDRCTIADADLANCAPDTVVGSVTTEIGSGSDLLAMTGTVNNVETDTQNDNEPARMAVIFDVQVGPYNLGKMSIPVTTQIVTGSQPSDLAVDTHTVIPQRYEGVPVRMRSMQLKLFGKVNGQPFMINPSRCGTHTVTADMKAPSGDTASGSFSYSTVGCPAGFNPSIATSIPTGEGGIPTGFTFKVTSPGDSSSIQTVKTTLPEGFEINPGVANQGGPNALDACSPSDIDNGDFSSCPNAQIGTVKLDTPLLPMQRTGAVYLETPGNTPQTRYKLAIVVDLPGPDLVVHGQAQVNGSGDRNGGGTGQVSATFDNLPDLQFSNLEVTFAAGDHAMLTSPKACGSYQSSADLTPWSMAPGQSAADATVTRTSDVTIDSGCGADTFAPTFQASLEANPQTSNPNAQAASPDLNLQITAGAKDERLEKMTIGLPVGLVANTTAADQCSQLDAADGNCLSASKIGEVTTEVGAGGDPLAVSGEIFNVAPNADEPARLAAAVSVNVGPYDLGKLVIPVATKILPGSESDPQRRYGIDAITDVPTRFEGVAIQMRSIDMTMYGQVGTPGNEKRFIVNPSECGSHNVTAELEGDGGMTASLSDDITIDSCANGFIAGDPTISAQVNPSETAVPTDFSMTVNSAENNQTFEKIETALPLGMTINPAFGNGFGTTMSTCDSAVVDSGDLSSCAAAQIGTVDLTTPLLPGTQHGKVYLETPPNGGANPNSRYLLVIAVDVPGQTLIVRGTTKIDGSTDLTASNGIGSTDENATGQMTAVFDNIPDLGFTSMTVRFDTGARSLLTNPETCGAQTVTASITPTSGSTPAAPTGSFVTSYDGAGGPCQAPSAEPFAPSFSATLSTTQAGGNPDMTIDIARADKTQQLKQLDIELPPGLVADTVATPRCLQADAALANCAETSRVGDVSTSVGTGSETLAVSGGIYNVETSNADEPARLAAVLGVQVGPYNLGKLSVPVTTEIIGNTADSLRILTHTTLPTRYEGIPVRVREMQIKLYGTANGNAFMINPSKCGAHTITAQMESTLGAAHVGTSNFTTTDCASAPYAPGITAALLPDGRAGKPVGLQLGFDLPGNNSSTKKITTILPAAMGINPGVGNLAGPLGSDPMTCAPADVEAGGGACPAASKIGTVTLDTPLLPTQRTGFVYLEDPGVGAANRYRIGIYVSLPGASLAVHGSATVDGSSDLSNGLGSVNQGSGQVTATFDNLPDLQFSHLQVTFNTSDGGNNHALLLNPETCGNHVVRAEMTPWSRETGPAVNADANVSVTNCSDPVSPLGLTASLSSYGVGEHADFTMDLTRPDGNRSILSTKFELPKGLVGSADATPTCPDDSTNAQIGVCDAQTKVGEVEIGIGSTEDTYELTGDIYNVAAPSNRPAKLTFAAHVQVGPYDLGRVVVPVDVNIDPNDYYLWAQTGDMPQRFEGIAVRVNSMKMKLFGLAPNTLDHKPFMSNPRSCNDPLEVKATVNFVSGAPVELSDNNVGPFTGCGALNLDDNTVDVVNHNDNVALDHKPEAPTAVRVTVHQGNSASQAGMKDMTLKLPGFRLNAPVADDVGENGACTQLQLDAQNCPASSRIGRVWLDTALLPKNVTDPENALPGQHSLWGSVYLLTPGSTAADRYKMAIQLTGKTLITIPGTAVVDETDNSPTEGDMVTKFTDLPDIPFDDMQVEIYGVDGGSGVTPLLLNPENSSTTDPRTVSGVGASMTAWSDAPGAPETWKDSTTPVTVTAGTAKTFDPGFASTFSTMQSGTHPDTTFTYTRADGQLDIQKVKMSLPPGFLGSAAAVPQCPVATAAAGNCPASSKVGTVQVEVGQYGKVLSLPGTVYMTAGVSGDIAGMSIKVAAKAGPYDLGNFITQGRIKLRPTDHGIDVDFDDVPNMFKGVPTHVSSMVVDMPGTVAGKPFLFNASNCAASQVVTTVTPYGGGAAATKSTPYQATGCAARTFSPSISFAASNVVDDRTAPSWTIKMSMNPGDSTLSATTVLLPSVMTVNVAGLSAACPAEIASQGHGACPASSLMGTVTVNTPLLPTPVTGNVYMAKSISGSGLPDMLLDIPEPIDMQIRGANSFLNSADSASRIKSTFSNLPDLIWSDMTMTISGGPKGILGLRTDGACGAADAVFDSNSGQHVVGSGVVSGLEGFCGNIDKTCAAPHIKVSTKGVKKKKNKKATTKLSFSTPSNCKAIKSATVTYPKGSKFNKKLITYNKKKKATKKNLKNLTGKLASRSLTSKDFKIKGKNGITFVPVFPDGTRSFSISTKNSALVLPYKTFCGHIKKGKKYKKALKKCQKKKVTFTISVTNVDGSSYRVNYTVPAGSRSFK